jgi:hypothetical protein
MYEVMMGWVCSSDAFNNESVQNSDGKVSGKCSLKLETEVEGMSLEAPYGV